MLYGKKPYFSRLRQLLNRRIAERTHPEDGVCASTHECVIRVLIAGANKLKIFPVQAKMAGHMQKGLKLSPALRQGNPPALQVHQALHRGILSHQELESVVVEHRHSPSLRARQDVGLCGR